MNAESMNPAHGVTVLFGENWIMLCILQVMIRTQPDLQVCTLDGGQGVWSAAMHGKQFLH